MKEKSIQELLEFGIINIDKPSGPTSFDISDLIRRKLKEFGIRKTSHLGTLDPKVTGVLPIALNRACKLTGFFLGEDKTYIGIMRLHEEKNLKEIQEVIDKKFLGKIKQIPPVKSRVKRQEREREIKRFEVLEQDENKKDFLFITEVQGGTYIRKLIDDLGKELKIGAHMLELRRIRAGIFNEDDKEYPSVNIYELEKAIEEFKKGKEDSLKKIIIPAKEAVKKVYPSIQIRKDNLKKILTGKPVYKEDLLINEKIKTNNIISVFNEDNFIGMYKVINDKNIFAKAEFVFQPINN